MLRPPVHVAALALWPSFAFAHGEDSLVLLFGEAIIVAGCCVASLVVLTAQRAWVGIVACLVGVAAAWVVTLDMPFRDNQTLITWLHLALPLVATAAAILIARRFWTQAPNSALERTREERRAAQRGR